MSTELQRLRRTVARYKDALLYARSQSHIGSQLRGIEAETYCAWIHEQCSKALGMRQMKWRKSL